MTPEFVNMLVTRPRGVVLFETIEMSHPRFSKTYHILRNAVPKGSITVTLETGATAICEYVPSKIQ